MQLEKCEICGKLGAVLYVCQNCKCRVCEECFETNAGVCTDCYKRLKSEAPMLETTSILMKVFLLGFVLVFIGIILMMVAASLYGTATTSGAVVIFIGPIPIIVGTGPHYIWAILLATVLTIFGLIFFLMMRKKGHRG